MLEQALVPHPAEADPSMVVAAEADPCGCWFLLCCCCCCPEEERGPPHCCCPRPVWKENFWMKSNPPFCCSVFNEQGARLETLVPRVAWEGKGVGPQCGDGLREPPEPVETPDMLFTSECAVCCDGVM